MLLLPDVDETKQLFKNLAEQVNSLHNSNIKVKTTKPKNGSYKISINYDNYRDTYTPEILHLAASVKYSYNTDNELVQFWYDTTLNNFIASAHEEIFKDYKDTMEVLTGLFATFQQDLESHLSIPVLDYQNPKKFYSNGIMKTFFADTDCITSRTFRFTTNTENKLEAPGQLLKRLLQKDIP